MYGQAAGGQGEAPVTVTAAPGRSAGRSAASAPGCRRYGNRAPVLQHGVFLLAKYPSYPHPLSLGCVGVGNASFGKGDEIVCKASASQRPETHKGMAVVSTSLPDLSTSGTVPGSSATDTLDRARAFEEHHHRTHLSRNLPEGGPANKLHVGKSCLKAHKETCNFHHSLHPLRCSE